MVLVWSMEFSNLCDARAAGNAGHTVPRKYRFSFNPLVPPFSLILSLFYFFILFWCVFYPGDMFHWKWLEKLFCRFHRFRLDLKCEWNSKEDEEKMISGKCVVQGRYNLTSSHFFLLVDLSAPLYLSSTRKYLVYAPSHWGVIDVRKILLTLDWHLRPLLIIASRSSIGAKWKNKNKENMKKKIYPHDRTKEGRLRGYILYTVSLLISFLYSSPLGFSCGLYSSENVAYAQQQREIFERVFLFKRIGEVSKGCLKAFLSCP